MKYRLLSAARGLLAATLLFTVLPAGAAGGLTLGTVSPQAVREHAQYQPLADYLAARLEEPGVPPVRVHVAASVDEMAHLIRSGRVDLYIDSAYPTVLVRQSAGTELLAIQERESRYDYRSVIFTRRDLGIATLSDLAGRTMVFRAPSSTSSYFLPKAAVLETGLPMIEGPRRGRADSTGAVTFEFSGDNESSLLWVLEGKADAGAMSRDHFERLGGSGFEELEVIHETRKVPRHAISHRVSLDPDRVASIRRVLTGMHLETEGRAVLEKLNFTRRFAAVDPDSAAAFEWLESMARGRDTDSEG